MTEELRKKLTTKRWFVLIASCLINLCIGSLYAWSVFSAPMAAHLTDVTGNEFTSGTLAIVFTVANAVGPITMISGGSINDKLGPKWVIFAGGILFGAGMIISSFANSMAPLMIGYGICCGLGMGLVYGCTISNSVKFFPDKSGLIGGIATASYGISSVLIPPIANAIISSSGVLNAFRLIGIAFIIIICGGAFLIEKCPPGFTPAGWHPQSVSKKTKSSGSDKNWRGMLTDPIFYVMILMLTCGAVFGLMMISQASPIAQNMIGMSVDEATAVVSILALFNAAGRVAAGYISDKIGRINTLTIMLALGIAGLLLLFFSGTGSFVTFYIGVSVVGICFGSFMGVFPAFTAGQFGQKNNSVNYGIMFIGFAIAGYVGPTIVSSVYNSSGSYTTAFLIAIGLAVFGILLTFVYRVLARKNK